MTASPSWYQLTLQAGEHSVEQLEDALLTAGALAVTLSDAADTPVLEPLPGQTPLWPDTQVTGLFQMPIDHDALVLQLCQLLECPHLPRVQPDQFSDLLEERDWVRAWMDHYHPMQFGTHLWICPTHLDPPDPHATTVMLDPGLAFGTGTHPTTALCLMWLDTHRFTLHNAHVIDYGCGSGVLGIAASLLGAGSVAATDIDPQAVLSTQNNAERNRVQLRCTLPEQFTTEPGQVLLANILAGPLMALAPVLTHLTRIGGHIVLAGLLERDADAVEAAYPQFQFQARETMAGWTRLWGIRQH